MHARPLLAIAVAILAGGCISPQNDRAVIGTDLRLEALMPVAPSTATKEVPASSLALRQPSVISVDRTNWQPMILMVPVDGTAHNPSYVRHVVFASSTARQRRDYPTILSSLELTGGSETDQQFEAVSNWGMGALDILMIIPRMIIQAPTRTRWSPSEAYARYWHPERPGALPDEEPTHEGPFVQPAPTPVTP